MIDMTHKDVAESKAIEIDGIEFVKVTRCKNCKHSKVLNKWFLYCTLHDIKNTPLIMDNFFCADGERKEGW